MYVFVKTQMGIWPNSLTIAKAIAVACRDSDVRNVKALIIGPPETPYEFGYFDVGGQVITLVDELLTVCASVQRQISRRLATGLQHGEVLDD